MTERCTVNFKGRVQGVGFRITACHVVAACPGLTGWVRNEADGSVMMVVEGNHENINSCLGDLRRRMGGNITQENIQWSAAVGQYQDFTIRY